MRKAIIVFAACMLVMLACTTERNDTTESYIEFRLAELSPADGLEMAVFKPTGQEFWLHPDVLMSDKDVASASPTGTGGNPAIEVVLTESAAAEFAQFTEEHLSQHVAILVEGEVVSVPVIRRPIDGGKVLIVGEFTREETEQIAAKLVARASAKSK